MLVVAWRAFEMTTSLDSAALSLLRDDMFSTDERGIPKALQGTRCTDCGRVFFPSRLICSHCGLTDAQLVPHRMSMQGVIHASTVVRVPSSLGHAAPYAYGYVDLPMDGTRIFSPFSGAALTAFTPGTKVRLVLGEISASAMRGVLGYSFAPDELVGYD